MLRMEVCCAYFDPDYDNLNEKIYGTRVSVDNESCAKCTVVKVNSLNKQDLLLEVLQVLIDMELSITKSYISSDAGWFMDVFHVKDQKGNKVYDRKVIGYIEQAICTRESQIPTVTRSKEFATKNDVVTDCTAIEMIGHNRPGIFSEISAVLAEQRCNIVEAHAWSYKDSLACVAFVSDESTSTPINDPTWLAIIEDHLGTVLRPATPADDDRGSARAHQTGVDITPSHTERRLHQLMFANRDFDGPSVRSASSFPMLRMGSYEAGRKTVISIDRCNEKGYSIVNVECMDRPKLMFDTVCTLTDMQFVVFHASASSQGHFASQEYYVRQKDGRILDTADERQLAVKCLEAAVERRTCEGVKLELCTENNNVGLLSYITRVLRENGLTVAQADIATDGERTRNVFYVQDISGSRIDMGVVESVRRELEPLAFQVKNELLTPRRPRHGSAPSKDGFCILGLLRSQLQRLSPSFISI